MLISALLLITLPAFDLSKEGLQLFRSELAESVSCRDSSVDKKVAAGDKRAIRPQEQSGKVSGLVGGSGPPGCGLLDHASTSRIARAGKLVIGERGNDYARADCVDPCIPAPGLKLPGCSFRVYVFSLFTPSSVTRLLSLERSHVNGEAVLRKRQNLSTGNLNLKVTLRIEKVS